MHTSTNNYLYKTHDFDVMIFPQRSNLLNLHDFNAAQISFYRAIFVMTIGI